MHLVQASHSRNIWLYLAHRREVIVLEVGYIKCLMYLKFQMNHYIRPNIWLVIDLHFSGFSRWYQYSNWKQDIYIKCAEKTILPIMRGVSSWSIILHRRKWDTGWDRRRPPSSLLQTPFFETTGILISTYKFLFMQTEFLRNNCYFCVFFRSVLRWWTIMHLFCSWRLLQ